VNNVQCDKAEQLSHLFVGLSSLLIFLMNSVHILRHST